MCVMNTVSLWKARGDHVGIAYCFDLVNVIFVDCRIEEKVKIVEKLDHLNAFHISMSYVIPSKSLKLV